MDANILLSKIVANPTDTTWAQVYSTLNLYVVMSIKSEEKSESLVTDGKELLERIQREYFSLDTKDLKSIKESIEKAVEPIKDKNVSIVLATINENVLYIVTASLGVAVLKRNGKVGTVAAGEEGQILAFSGELLPNDIVILETGDFATKIPVAKLTEVVDSLEVSEISENLAPLIHEGPVGSEAAIILQYKNLNGVPVEDKEEVIEKKEDREDEEEEKEDEKGLNDEPTDDTFAEPPRSKFKMPTIGFPKLPKLGAKKLIPLVIVILAIVLIGSIFLERGRQDTIKRQAVLAEILTPAEKKFDEANALLALNKGLALDEFNNIKAGLDGSQSKIKEGTPERKKLDEFIGKVEGKIGELTVGSTLSNQKLIFDKDPELVQFKEGRLVAVAPDGKVSLLKDDGSVEDSFDTKNGDANTIAVDETNIYISGAEGITRTTNAGSTKTTVEDPGDVASMDTFGTNLYALNTDTKTIDKYAGGASPRSSYFKGDITLSNPVSMAIDGSIWIIDDGKVRRFTKGEEDTFTASGLTRDISENSEIFTSIDYANIYVLDRDSARIISLSKDGEVKNQYVSKDLGNASSFAVDESGNKIYVVISGKLYSFDL